MTNIQEKPKYLLKKYLSPDKKREIMEKLNISEKTYYRKINAKVKDSNGFEFYQLIIICCILNQDLFDIINPEALEYYEQKYRLSNNKKFFNL